MIGAKQVILQGSDLKTAEIVDFICIVLAAYSFWLTYHQNKVA